MKRTITALAFLLFCISSFAQVKDLYQGTKYEDTAITEIFFDGIDVH